MNGHFTSIANAPIARALDRRGHDVVVAAEPGFATAIEREGLRAVGIGRDLTLDDLLAVLPDLATVAPEDQDAYARPRVFVELRANNALDDLRAGRMRGAAVLVVDELDMVPENLRRKLLGWATEPQSSLLLVGMGNTVNYMQNKAVRTIDFKPYDEAGLVSGIQGPMP